MQSRIKEKVMKIHLLQIVDEHSRRCEQVVDILCNEMGGYRDLMKKIMLRLDVEDVEKEGNKVNE